MTYHQPLDSRLEEAIARLPGMAWFDSRRSGDAVGYVHKVIWVMAACALAALLLGSTRAWYGGAAYLAIYTPVKIRETLAHWRAWRDGASQLGPWRDARGRAGINFGFLVDGLLDLTVAYGAVILACRLGA